MATIAYFCMDDDTIARAQLESERMRELGLLPAIRDGQMPDRSWGGVLEDNSDAE